MEDADATELETPASSKPSSARKISQKHASTVTSMTIAVNTNDEPVPDINMSSLSLKIRPLSWVQPLEAELARKRERNQTSSERSNTLDISKSLDLLTVDTTETRQLSEEDTTSSELEGRKEMGNKGKTQTVKKRKSGVGLREVQALLSLSQLTETSVLVNLCLVGQGCFCVILLLVVNKM
jgi:hypothetical protein